MYLNRLIFVAVFMFLPCAQIMILASQAYAVTCCACGSSCAGRCTCPGSHPDCEWCAAPNSDPETVKSSTSSTGDPSGAVNIRSISGPMLSSAAENITSDIRQINGRKGLMLKLVENDIMKYDLKFSCPQGEEDYLQGNRLGLQVKADIKK